VIVILVVVVVIGAALGVAWAVDRRERRVRAGRTGSVDPMVGDLRRDLMAGDCRQFTGGEAAGWTDRARRRP
jgi:hypothetical protein